MTWINLLPLLLVTTKCYCAPEVYRVGGTFGGSSNIDATIGGQGTITNDGLALDATDKGLVGASWRPQAFAGGYLQTGQDMYAADGFLGAYISNYASPYGHFAGGIDSNGNIPLAFEPGIKLESTDFMDPKVGLYTDEDAWAQAVKYGANPPFYPPYPYARSVPELEDIDARFFLKHF